MTLTEKIATLYHTARGTIKMKFNSKNAKFKPKDYLVQVYMRLVVTGRQTLKDVPNFGNLREMVKGEVDRINSEWEEIEKARKEELEKLQKERKEEHAE